MESSSANVHIASEGLRGRSTSCFVYGFVFQVISKKTLCSKYFTRNLRDFYMEIVLTIIATNLVANLLLSFFFCHFKETKNKNKMFSKLLVWLRKTFLFYSYLFFFILLVLYFHDIRENNDLSSLNYFFRNN